MKNSFARAFLQVLALLTGLAIATVWRDQHNSLANYPELQSVKATLGLAPAANEEFLLSPATLAGGALNLAAGRGHQEVLLDRLWDQAPTESLRVRGDSAGELGLEFRPQGKPGNRLALRLSNRPGIPSAWLEVNAEGRFLAKWPLKFELPKGRWVNVSVANQGGRLLPEVDGVSLAAHDAPAGPVRVLFRGDSDSGRLRIEELRVEAGGATYERSFEGEIPWLLFLLATVAASLLFFGVEFFTSPRLAATIAGLGFLVLCAGLTVSRGILGRAEPGGPEALRLDLRAETLARVKGPQLSRKPIIVWLGGAHAWGSGASDGSRTTISRLAQALDPAHAWDWVDAAFPGARTEDLKPMLDAAVARGRVVVVLVFAGGPNSDPGMVRTELRKLVDAVRAIGARPLLVPIPMDPVREGKYRPNRAAVETVARETGSPIANLQPAFEAHADEGILWWDITSLTDEGARLEAEWLAAPLKDEIARIP